jgi:hypothetical protein
MYNINQIIGEECMWKINMKLRTQDWNVSGSKVESKGDNIGMNSTERGREWRQNYHSIRLAHMLEHCVIEIKSGSMHANVLY